MGLAAVFSLSSAVASDSDPAFEAVVVASDAAVSVVDADGATFELVNGAALIAEGIVADGDLIWVERVVKNPRTVVALEDTYF